MHRLALLVLVSSTAVFANDLVPVIGPLNELATAPRAVEFKFLVPRGAKPAFRKTPLPGGTIVTNAWAAQFDGRAYFAATTDHPPFMSKPQNVDRLFELSIDNLFRQANGKRGQSRALTLDGMKGLEVAGTSDDGPITTRNYWNNGRLFTLAVIGPPNDTTRRFLDGLAIEGEQKSLGTDEAPAEPAPPREPVADGPAPSSARTVQVELRDPANDDFGPGRYKYPTDPVYRAGSFDLLALRVTANAETVNFDLELRTPVGDPWKMGTGFSLQHAVVFLDLDGNPKNGSQDGLPGLNVRFAPGHGWDRAIIATPHAAARVINELKNKAGATTQNYVVPEKVTGAGRFIHFEVPRKQLAEKDPKQWRYQVTLGGQDGFPANGSVLVKPVNEYEGLHRFGGGTDTNCDPHVLDVFSGLALGTTNEAEGQRKQLQYECGADGTAKRPAMLELITVR